MKKWFIPFLLVSSLFFASCGSTHQLSAEQSIDGIMTEYAKPNGPGASVLVMDHDSIVFTKS